MANLDEQEVLDNSRAMLVWHFFGIFNFYIACSLVRSDRFHGACTIDCPYAKWRKAQGLPLAQAQESLR